MPGKTVVAKVSDWYTAYGAIKEELTPDVQRQILGAVENVDSVATLAVTQRLAMMIAANDRAAAIAAAILTANGVTRAVPMEIVEDE